MRQRIIQLGWTSSTAEAEAVAGVDDGGPDQAFIAAGDAVTALLEVVVRRQQQLLMGPSAEVVCAAAVQVGVFACLGQLASLSKSFAVSHFVFRRVL